ncbi:MAG: FtsX-like permease family protein [Proteobacteria bacterium]|nr:FtsX-like permease family protein [Pseudomonadota bacterium]
MRLLSLALRLLAREWRAGELRVLLLALTVAVGALTGVGFLVDRIGAAVAVQAAAVLAADIRLGSPQPIPDSYLREAARRGLASTRSVNLLSVVFNGEASQLANIAAVTAGYPLRGQVLTAATAFGAGVPAAGIPAAGEVWPDSRLLAALGAQLGSRLSIGAAQLRVARVLVSRPDQGGTFAELAPSLIMNAADLPATQLIQPGSRASYAALFAGERAAVDDFKRWLQDHKQGAERLRDISDASPQLRNAVDRSGRFLSLAALVSVLLCAIAVAMAARRYVSRHLDTVALLKTLGSSRAFILGVAVAQLVVLALLAGSLGAALGYLAQEGLLRQLRGLLALTALPPPGLVPLALGFVTALALLAGFAVPALLQLARVPALRVLRRDVGPPPPRMLLTWLPAIAIVLGLIAWVTPDARTFGWFSIGLSGLLLLLAAAGALLVALTSRLRGSVGVAWRFGIANLGRRRGETVLQLVALGTGLMVLLLLSVLRTDLTRDWRRSLPANLPNYFFVNIPPAQRDAFVEFLGEHGARTARLLPMVRGRLTHINGRAVEEPAAAADPGRQSSGSRPAREEGFATREQNLTWSAQLGQDNRIIAGHWWTAADYGRPLVSLASEFRDALGVQVGDRLRFDIAGEALDVRVASIRKVKWDTFQPNFFIMFPPGVLEGTAGTWMTSAYITPGTAPMLAQLAHRFPSVSIFDIEQLLAQVRSLLDRAALAVQSVFAFTLVAGLAVLLAAVQSSLDARRYESAMLRTLGASRRTVLQGVLAEFASLGALAGLLAAAGATLAAWFLTSHWLELRYTFSLTPWLAGVVAGTALVALAGWLATRSVVNQPPLRSLS